MSPSNSNRSQRVTVKICTIFNFTIVRCIFTTNRPRLTLKSERDSVYTIDSVLYVYYLLVLKWTFKCVVLHCVAFWFKQRNFSQFMDKSTHTVSLNLKFHQSSVTVKVSTRNLDLDLSERDFFLKQIIHRNFYFWRYDDAAHSGIHNCTKCTIVNTLMRHIVITHSHRPV